MPRPMTLRRAQNELNRCLQEDGSVNLHRLSDEARQILRGHNRLHSPRRASPEQIKAWKLLEYNISDGLETHITFRLFNLPGGYDWASRLEVDDGDLQLQLPPLLGTLNAATMDAFFEIKEQTTPDHETLELAREHEQRKTQEWEDDISEALDTRPDISPEVKKRLYPALEGDQLYGRPLNDLTLHQLVDLSSHEHPVVWVTLPSGQIVPVDEEMAPVIRRLNSDGMKTLYCCQGDPERGGAYIAVSGVMPRVLEDLCLILGLEFRQETERWMIWDTAPRPQRRPWRTMFMRLMQDLATGGLPGLDSTGQTYLTAPLAHGDPLTTYREARQAWQTRMNTLAAQAREEKESSLLG